MRIEELLENRTNLTPTKRYVRFPDRDVSFTFEEVADSAKRYANVLSDAGVEGGDRVSIFLPNRPEFLHSFFACGYLGAIAASPHPSWQPPELQHSFEISTPQIVITTPDLLDITIQATEGTSVEHVFVTGRAKGYDSIAALSENYPASIGGHDKNDRMVGVHQYTSGTTGLPKAVAQDHHSWTAAPSHVHKVFGITFDDTHLTGFPLSHGNAQLWGVIGCLCTGSDLVVYSKFSLSNHWDRCSENDVTWFATLGSMLNQLYKQDSAETDTPVRLVFTAGAETDMIEPFEDRYGVDIYEGYGLTEAPYLIINPPNSYNRRLGSFGSPPPEKQVRIMGNDGEEVPRRREGEIQLKGFDTMEEYVNNEKKTNEAFNDGWLATGDYGYMDDDGFVYFVDRQENVIRRSGENISSEEVENVIKQMDEVADAAVVGVSDPKRDEEVKAFIELKVGEDLASGDVIDFCENRLARFKHPRYIEFRDLPKTDTAKVQKEMLRDIGITGSEWDREEEREV